MSEKDRYEITFETWNKVAELYQEKFMDMDLYNKSYDLFCELILNPNAKVLDIGCGPGNITKYLLSKKPGWKILGIDVAAQMISLAKVNNPTADFEVVDIRNIDHLADNFDGLVAGFCIPYLSKPDCSKFISDCTLRLQNDGIFYLSFVEGDHEMSGYKTGSSGDKAYFYYYEETWLLRELEAQDFKLIRVLQTDYPTGQTSEIHKMILAKK